MTRGLHDKKDRPGRQWEKQHARGMLKCKWEFRLVAKKKTSQDFQIALWQRNEGWKKKYPFKPNDVPSKSNTKNMPTLPYAVLQIDFGRSMGCLRGLSLACLSVSSHLNDEHSRDSTEHSLSQNNLLHRDGQQNLQPCAHSCPETALPVLPPGQSIAAEFGASGGGRKRARRISPTRQKTREGILEWKEERTERSYNKTQTETQTLYSLVILSTEMQLQKFCDMTAELHIRIKLIS